MAIVTETHTLNGRQFVRTWSDAGRYIVGGVPQGQYTEANDPAELGRVYTEGDIIPPEEGGESAEAKALVRYSNELTGVNNTTLQEATETLIKQLKEGK